MTRPEEEAHSKVVAVESTIWIIERKKWQSRATSAERKMRL